MNKKTTIFLSVLIISLFTISAGSSIGMVNAQSLDEGVDDNITPSAASTTPLADEDTIVDPRGQTVKESADLDLRRETTVSIINPIDWNLEVNGFDVIDAQIPLNLDLILGMGFPLKAETSYNPYDVLDGENFDFVINVDNEDCTPYITLGYDFGLDFSELNFEVLGGGNLLGFATEWGSIEESKSIDLPIYGIETKLGDWINYDIVDKYYSIDELLSIVGANVKLSDYGIRGGVGVNINYNLHSWVSANIEVQDPSGSATQSSELIWQSTGDKQYSVSISEDSLHGQYYSITVGDWVYHIAQDVTFSVWADIGFDIFGIQLIDETFKYSYTLGLGEITFPEREDYTFQSNPQVLSGKAVKNVEASYDLIRLNLDSQGQSDFSLVNYNWEIPDVPQITEWFDDMDIAAGVSAGISVDFPFNMQSYYNSRKVTPGSTFDYNVLVDSIGADTPGINYDVSAYFDLSSVDIMGFQLDNYEFDLSGSLFEFSGISTPFDKQRWEYEITSLVQLDTASDMLNEYIASMLYGINPDIQFRAWVLLDVEGQLSGTASVSDGYITEATDFVWNEQFDTQTSRIQIPGTMNAGDNLTVTYSDLQYDLSITPGIKIGVSMLGGIIGFDFPIMIPVDIPLNGLFNAPDFVEEITIADVNVDADNLVVENEGVIPNGVDSFTGTFDLTNVGGELDNYVVSLIDDGLPSGTTATITPQQSLSGVNPGEIVICDYTVNLGVEAHKSELQRDLLQFKVQSLNPLVYDIVSAKLTLMPHPDYIPKASIIMESSVNIRPGVGVVVPVGIRNDALISYTYSLGISGDTVYATLDSGTSFELAPGEIAFIDMALSVPVITPQTKSITVTVGADGEGASEFSKNLDINIVAFTDVSINLHETNNVDGSELINLGDTSDYLVSLKNAGNIQASVEFWIESETIKSYNVASNLGKTSVDINAQSQTVVSVTLGTSNLKPGIHSFTLFANDTSSETIFSQNFTINIVQIKVSNIYADGSYEFDGDTITYTIVVQNVGNKGDTFDFSLTGLDGSTYALKTSTGVFADGVFLPAGAPTTLTLEINVEDIRKVLPDVNAFQLASRSVSYDVVGIGKASAVKMPAVYGFKIAEDTMIQLETDELYTMTFTIENTGNVDDVFTIIVDGIGNQYYEIYAVSDSVFVSSEDGNNTIVVGRGEIVSVSVYVYKSEGGRHRPVVNIINGENEILQSFKGSFSLGSTGSWWIILLAVVGSFGAVALGFKAYAMREERAMYGEERTSRFATIKDKINQKKKEKLVDKLQKEELASLEPKEEVKEVVKEEKVKRVKKVKVEKEPGPSILKKGMLKTSDKINSWKERRQDMKNLAEDESFWDDEPIKKDKSLDEELFEDDGEGWN